MTRIHSLGWLSTIKKFASTLALAFSLTLGTGFLRGQDTAMFSWPVDFGQALAVLREVDPSLTNNLVFYTKNPELQQVNNALRTYLTQAGVNLNSPNKLVSLDLGSGLLWMRDLDEKNSANRALVEKLASNFQSKNPTQVTLETQFADLNDALAREVGLDWILGDAPNPDPTSGWKLGECRAILTQGRRDAIITALKARPEIICLGAPRMTTLSGRQAGISVHDTDTQIPTHRIDLLPVVVPELRTIDLYPVLRGYPSEKSSSEHTNFTSSVVRLYDSQTAVMVQKQKQTWSVAFVAVRLIDPAGNPLNAVEDMPFATSSIPVRVFPPVLSPSIP